MILIRILIYNDTSKSIRLYKTKKLRIGFDYQDVWNEEHLTAFTAAKVMQLDILQDMKESIEKAIENGETLEQFKKIFFLYSIKKDGAPARKALVNN